VPTRSKNENMICIGHTLASNLNFIHVVTFIDMPIEDAALSIYKILNQRYTLSETKHHSRLTLSPVVFRSI
jgi:hypothetical protein